MKAEINKYVKVAELVADFQASIRNNDDEFEHLPSYAEVTIDGHHQRILMVTRMDGEEESINLQKQNAQIIEAINGYKEMLALRNVMSVIQANINEIESTAVLKAIVRFMGDK